MSSEGLSMIQGTMSSLGFNTPISRFVGLFTITNVAVMVIKPSFLVDEQGELKGYPWLPWWTPGVVIGGAAALFL